MNRNLLAVRTSLYRGLETPSSRIIFAFDRGVPRDPSTQYPKYFFWAESTHSAEALNGSYSGFAYYRRVPGAARGASQALGDKMYLPRKRLVGEACVSLKSGQNPAIYAVKL